MKRKNEEAKLQLQILHYLRIMGYACGKIKTKGSISKQGNFIYDKFQWRGLPDLLVFTPKLLFLEVKFGKGRQSEAQMVFQVFCDKAGVVYRVVKDLDDVKGILRKVKLRG